MNIETIYSHFLNSSGACTDTRKIEKNCLFFALKGENFNGNTFAEQAIIEGACFSIVDEEKYAVNDQCILVENVLQTLQQLATYHRRKLNTPIIALTGSNGKTTTKELINSVLSTTYKSIATQGNLNNHIGVPLTLLRLNAETEIAIVEMGANHPNEIEFLCNIALPDYGLITNFGKAHLEGFGSLEGVINAKSELYEHLKRHHKTIFINSNDPIQIRQVGGFKNTCLFGSASDKFKIELISSQPFVKLRYNEHTIISHLTGAYNFDNISAAIAIGQYFKVEDENIIGAIENYIPTNNRSQIIERNDNIIIMDAYNANPTSMLAALDNFKQLDHDHKILFLGDMFELGTTAEIEHQTITDYFKNNTFETINLIGKNFFKTQTSIPNINKFETFEALKSELEKSTLSGKHILIKGSRGMALERILNHL